jgi:ABC-type enterochelin transport system permease subunit
VTQNVGNIDRILRLVAGLVLLSLIFIGPKTWWGLLGIVPLATAFMRTCPAYSILGVSTCERK